MRILEHANGQVAGVAARWKRQYYHAGTWSKYDSREGMSTEATYQALMLAQTPADVARIIGNDSWTGYTCSECRTHVELAIQIGSEDSAEDRIQLCLPCVDRIGQYLRGVRDALGAVR